MMGAAGKLKSIKKINRTSTHSSEKRLFTFAALECIFLLGAWEFLIMALQFYHHSFLED